MSTTRKKKEEEKSDFFKISQPGLAARLSKTKNIIATGLIQHEIEEQEVGLREGSGVGAEEMPKPSPTSGEGSLFGKSRSLPFRTIEPSSSAINILSKGTTQGPIQGPDSQSFMRDIAPFRGDFDSPNPGEITRARIRSEVRAANAAKVAAAIRAHQIVDVSEEEVKEESLSPPPSSKSSMGLDEEFLTASESTAPSSRSSFSSEVAIPEVSSELLSRGGNNRDILNAVVSRQNSEAPIRSVGNVSISSDLPDLVSEGKHDTDPGRPNDLREEKFQERAEMESDLDEARGDFKEEFSGGTAPIEPAPRTAIDILGRPREASTPGGSLGAGALEATEAAVQLRANRRAAGARIFSPEEKELFSVEENDIDGDGNLSAAETALAQNGDDVQSRVGHSSALLRRIDNEPGLASAIVTALKEDPDLSKILGKLDPDFQRLLIKKKPVKLDADSQVNLIQQGFAHYLDDVNLFNVAFV